MLDIQASTASTPASTLASLAEKDSNDIKIVFSDLDGTLIHYPQKEEVSKVSTSGGRLLEFPKSSTGLVGVISAKTLSLVDEIRNQNKVKFVLISGMRTSTLLQRLPYLPRADAYCSENGGRIFYRVEKAETKEDGDDTKRIIKTIDGDDEDDDVFWVHPKRYRHEGRMGSGDPHRNRVFGIREDKAWRKKMIAAIGGDSFGSFSLQETFDDPGLSSMPLNERDGLLWDFARDLIHNHGFVLDTKGYSTCFRVNKKQQKSEALTETSPSEISALLKNAPWKDESSIASSVNLSCVDFYPSCSGKKNCCLYLASKFFPKECQPKLEETNELVGVATTDEDDIGSDDDAIDVAVVDTQGEGSDSNADVSTVAEEFLSNHAVCMCDDDNDLEMALACQHAYLPDIASESMRETIAKFPNQFTTTFSGDRDWDSEDEEEDGELRDSIIVEETDASDEALTIIWKRTYKEPDKAPAKRSKLSRTKISLALCCVAIFAVLK